MRQAMVAALVASLFAGATQADEPAAATVTARWNARTDNTQAGPAAAARSIRPELMAPTPDSLLVSTEASIAARLTTGVSAVGNLRLAHERFEGGAYRDDSRINEAHLAFGHGDWQLVAGKRVLGWDVGYAFRPNDVVQQQARRTLADEKPEGRPLLQLERLLPDAAWSLVWTQPQHWRDGLDAARGARESAWALQLYQRDGGLDLHGFGRVGRHSGASVGAAAAWVPGDALELHASWRAMQRHLRWQRDDAALISPVNPWHEALLGGASQWLAGGQWTVGPWNLMAEAWHDGTAPADATWHLWQQQNLALLQAYARGAPALPVAANLAWQASPLQGGNLRRRNVFARAAWQDGPMTISLDALATPQDRGRIVTAALQWKADRASLTAAWRWYGGPQTALTAQLPTRTSAVLMWSLSL